VKFILQGERGRATVQAYNVGVGHNFTLHIYFYSQLRHVRWQS